MGGGGSVEKIVVAVAEGMLEAGSRGAVVSNGVATDTTTDIDK